MAAHRRCDRDLRVDFGDRDRGAEAQLRGARGDVEAGNAGHARHLRIDVQRTVECTRDRSGQERHELREVGRVEGGGDTVTRLADAPVHHQRRRPDREVDGRVAHAIRRGAAAQRAMERGIGQMAPGCDRDIGVDLPFGLQQARRLELRVERSRGIGTEARGIEVPRDRVDRERALVLESEAPAPRKLAAARAGRESRHVEQTIVERGREIDGDASREPRVHERAGQVAASGRELGSETP